MLGGVAPTFGGKLERPGKPEEEEGDEGHSRQYLSDYWCGHNLITGERRDCCCLLLRRCGPYEVKLPLGGRFDCWVKSDHMCEWDGTVDLYMHGEKSASFCETHVSCMACDACEDPSLRQDYIDRFYSGWRFYDCVEHGECFFMNMYRWPAGDVPQILRDPKYYVARPCSNYTESYEGPDTELLGSELLRTGPRYCSCLAATVG
jgi:hypothetical protein